mgnify:CR=1 FL=1
MTNAPTMNAQRDRHRREQRALIDLARTAGPSIGGRHEGDSEVDARSAARRATLRQCPQRPREAARGTPSTTARMAPAWMTISNTFALLARVAEQRSGDDQVAGRRDRQEFGQALDDAEDECDEKRSDDPKARACANARERSVDCRTAIAPDARGGLA